MVEYETSNTTISLPFQKSFKELWEVFEKLLNKIQTLRDENIDLKYKLENASEYNENGDWSIVENYVEENGILKAEIENLKLQLDEWQNKPEIPDLRDELSFTKEEVLKFKERINGYENQLKDLSEKNLTLSSLENEILRLNEQLSENVDLIEKAKILEIEISSITEANQYINSRYDELLKASDEKNWIIKELESSLNDKNKSIDDLHKRVQDFEKIQLELHELLKNKESDFNLIRDNKEKLEAEITKLKINIRELTKKIEQFEKEKGISLFETHSEELLHFKNEKEILLNQIKDLVDQNYKFRSDLSKSRSGMLPINFGQDDDLQNKILSLESDLSKSYLDKKSFENKLVNLENLLILKTEEIEKLNTSINGIIEENKYNNSILKSRLLDLKKFMLDKGII